MMWRVMGDGGAERTSLNVRDDLLHPVEPPRWFWQALARSETCAPPSPITVAKLKSNSNSRSSLRCPGLRWLRRGGDGRNGRLSQLDHQAAKQQPHPHRRIGQVETPDWRLEEKLHFVGSRREIDAAHDVIAAQ